MDLDQCSKMIILESILTTFEVGVIFRAGGEVAKIVSSLKSNHHYQI